MTTPAINTGAKMTQHITQLSATNVKRLKAVRIDPSDGAVIIGGRNAQGKSSVLDSIAYALAGKGAAPARPVRDGEDSAEVTITTSAGLTIRRTFTPGGGGSLRITTADGMSPAKPQAFLDQLTAGGTCFDPGAWLAARPADQRAELLRVSGVDTAGVDARIASLRAERTDIGRRGKQAAGYADGLPCYPDAPDSAPVVADLLRDRDRMQQQNDEARQAHESAVYAHRAAREALGAALALVAHLEAELERARDAARDAELAVHSLPVLSDPVIHDTSVITSQIESAQDVAAQVRANEARSVAQQEADRLRSEYAAITQKIAEAEAEKAAAISSATLPVPGLGYDEDGVTFNDVPLAQCSQAERLRVAVAMAVARSPELRVILVRDAALLDSDSLRLLCELASEHDAQVWMERVGDGDDGAIVIEDGEVRA